jgi:hypothetical protein
VPDQLEGVLQSAFQMHLSVLVVEIPDVRRVGIQHGLSVPLGMCLVIEHGLQQVSECRCLHVRAKRGSHAEGPIEGSQLPGLSRVVFPHAVHQVMSLLQRVTEMVVHMCHVILTQGLAALGRRQALRCMSQVPEGIVEAMRGEHSLGDSSFRHRGQRQLSLARERG